MHLRPWSVRIRATWVATLQHSTIVTPSPGSRSNTRWSGGPGTVLRIGTRQSGTWNSTVAKLTAQISVGRSQTMRYSTASPSAVDGTLTFRIHSGGVYRRVLLEERALVAAGGTPLHGQRPISKVRQHDPGHLCVVVDHLPFGEAGGRVEHFLEIGHGELSSAHDHSVRRCVVRNHGVHRWPYSAVESVAVPDAVDRPVESGHPARSDRPGLVDTIRFPAPEQ